MDSMVHIERTDPLQATDTEGANTGTEGGAIMDSDGVIGSEVGRDEIEAAERNSTGDGDGGAAGGVMTVGLVVNETVEIEGDSGDSTDVPPAIEEIIDGAEVDTEPSEEAVRLQRETLGT